MPRKKTPASASSSSPAGNTPQGKKRQYNPKSLANLPAKKEGAKTTPMRLPESTRRMAAIVGEGSMTAGVERLFAQLPLFYRVKLYVEMQAAKGDTQAEALLSDLEALELERVHEEAMIEGDIHKPSGAWIV